MKIIIVMVILSILPSCASISMNKSGDEITWKSTTLWKDIQQVDAYTGPQGFNFGLGSSKGSLSAEQAQMLMCLMSPQMCK